MSFKFCFVSLFFTFSVINAEIKSELNLKKCCALNEAIFHDSNGEVVCRDLGPDDSPITYNMSYFQNC